MDSKEWGDLLKNVPTLVAQVQSLLPEPGNGLQKMQMVLGMLTPLIPEAQLATKIPQLTNYINVIVGFYKLFDFFKNPAPAAPVTPAVTPNIDI